MTESDDKTMDHGTSLDGAPRYDASLMISGDRHSYRSSTTDKYQHVILSQVPISEEYLLNHNNRLISLNPNLKTLMDNVWVPQLLDPKIGASPTQRFLKTGGRTCIYESLPESMPTGKILLNLQDFGWSEDRLYQEFIPEIKGSGTLLEDSGVSLGKLKDIALKDDDQKMISLITSLENQKDSYGKRMDPLCISSKNDRDRPKGSQIDVYEDHAMNVTLMLQEDFPVKFAPLLAVLKLPYDVKDRIRYVNRSLDSGEKLCSHSLEDYVQGVRLTPSTVRAVYLDKASDDGQIIELVKRISHDPDVLGITAQSMMKDARRYLRAITETTRQGTKGYLWAKVGDIHLSWQDDDRPKIWDEDEVKRYKTDHDFAWYLAKDMTIAAGTGYWFVDLESLRAGPRYQLCSDSSGVSAKEDLLRKHELYITCVLRDLNRVTTQFEIGRRLITDGSLSKKQRHDISEDVLDTMVSESNKDANINIKREGEMLDIQLYYPRAGFRFEKKMPLRQISRRY